MIDIRQQAETISQEASALQNRASDPGMNVWVDASAGTGKTKVLTDRVLRLLLPKIQKDDGVNPENILCLTFTKAGASEMIARIMEILSEWSICSDKKLGDSLEKLLQTTPSVHQKDKARRLFALVIDMPNGLNITTIHGFCQSLLGRFTMEAGLPPSFTVMEDDETKTLIQKAKATIIQGVMEQHYDDDITKNLDIIAEEKNSDHIDKIFKSVINQRGMLKSAITHFGDQNALTSHLKTALGLDQYENESDIFAAFFNDIIPGKDSAFHLCSFYTNGTALQAEKVQIVYDFYHADILDRSNLYQLYKSFFLTQKGDPKKLPAKIEDLNAIKAFDNAIEHILRYEDTVNSFHIFKFTKSILSLSTLVLKEFENLKIQQQRLDYNDLIDKTLSLLNSPMRDWILFKLDNKIHHVMVDESQDTNPQQWEIIQCLFEDFTSGISTDDSDITKTIFIVGDSKQSIFSFQGANSQVYDTVKANIAQRLQLSQSPFDIIPMNTSFRSTQAILSLVDSVFHSDDMREALSGTFGDYQNHTAYRLGDAGKIDLWPLYKAPKESKKDVWPLPISIKDHFDARAALAKALATQIHEWIDNKELLKSKNRPVQPKDIMILVRSRSSLVDHLIRSLKDFGIPVSGADRLVVSSHIAVKDIIAAFNFALMPDDDLNLACLLKSPFIEMPDIDIEKLCHNRNGTLWTEIKNSDYSSVAHYLSNLIQNLSGENAFTACNIILNGTTSNEKYSSGWSAMTKRLGQDCLDPLQELLTIALDYDQKNPGLGLQGFVHYFSNNQKDIKREMDHSDNVVRIMTVHASKGLQAPIVILPDTTSLPKSNLDSTDGFFWINEKTPLWSPSSKIKNDQLLKYEQKEKQKIHDEYQRLLYVALTRAEDRLIVCGSLNNKQPKHDDISWYASVKNGLMCMDHREDEWGKDTPYMIDGNDSVLIYETEQEQSGTSEPQDDIASIEYDIPHWIKNPNAYEDEKIHIVKPSIDEDSNVPVLSPLLNIDESYRFRRGNLTHDLLQYLPNIPNSDRENLGRIFLKKQASDLPENIQHSILEEVMAILSSEIFAPFFSNGSMAEVPLSGKIKNADGSYDLISGKIDRLCVQDGIVWIVDFKSNRPSPQNSNDIPAAYKKQLSVYKSLIRTIYPNHRIRCALLWTDGPHIMEINNV